MCKHKYFLRCQCNGHANECIYNRKEKTAKCKCNHNTYGKQCSKCKPFYWMNKWQPGSYGEELKGTSGLCRYFLKIYN